MLIMWQFGFPDDSHSIPVVARRLKLLDNLYKIDKFEEAGGGRMRPASSGLRPPPAGPQVTLCRAYDVIFRIRFIYQIHHLFVDQQIY